MSIPPLVCSTPPPPDQCEDDKDHGDFDIQYNLSQDDDNDVYDFGSFSTYNHFQSSQSKTNPQIVKVTESEIITDVFKECNDFTQNYLQTDITNELKVKLDEEINIEDLNLEDLKVSQDTIDRIHILETNTEAELKESPITDGEGTQSAGESAQVNIPNDLDIAPIQPDELVMEPSSIEQTEEPALYVDEIIAAVDDLQISSTEPEIPLDITKSDETIPNHEITELEKEEIGVVLEAVSEKPEQEVNADDDFGDFEDFQFANPCIKPATLDSCDNPWDKNEKATDSDFSDFKANFVDNKIDNNENDTFSTFFEVPANSVENKLEDKVEENKCPVQTVADNNDFGDFNDFQSSSADAQLSYDSEELLEMQQIPILNLQSPVDDDKLMENITSAIYSAFEDEMPDPEEVPEEKLDSVLGITWGYLLQTDERQPYMVNWNNSLGQKTLLKALCIDSRNILFGPKWNYNMPKYAATLSAAPLQPQKQISTPSTSQVETSHPETTTTKPPAAWSDPFTSDGQESCKPDAASGNPVIETGPTDLDVFEASTSSKPDKIFSKTLNVQPLRQISLPDTHIFTPTDSETPRSTTIHYDNSPTVLMPQTAMNTSKSEPSFKSEPQSLPSTSKAADNDEYWEFQDFKGSSDTTPTATNLAPQKSETSKGNTNITYGTQVLQPVKLKPIKPTLNWPDPGEVKETFDDFSDFISSSTLSNAQLQTPTVPVQKIDSKPINELDSAGLKSVVTLNRRVPNDASSDDDFDTFQSALPTTTSVDITNISQVSNTAGALKPIISPQASSKKMTDFNFAFPKVENVKSDTISMDNMNKPKDFFPSNLEGKNPPVHSSSTSAMSAGLLQPTVASMSSTGPSKKSAQILQPLSLESFSQINWPSPGIDLQDLSRFNPVETLDSLKSDLSVNSQSKVASPAHSQKNQKGTSNPSADDDWGEFVSSRPKPQQQTMPKKQTTFADDDEWTDFVSSPSVKPQNGLNTISLNVHTNFQSNPSKFSKGNKAPLEIPSLNYITPKSSKSYNDRHFQNL